MQKCTVCGGTYKDMLEVRYQGETRAFDSFECAIQALAPACAHCGCKVIGHGVEEGGAVFCCRHCAGTKTANVTAEGPRPREGAHDHDRVPPRRPSEPRARE